MAETFQVEFSDIAIIGMAGRFPDAKNIEQFWKNLLAGKESVRDFTENELKAAGVNEETYNQPEYVKRGAVLEDIEYFDADFFDFTPYDAKVTDPQQRLFLECAWEALEQAGYPPRKNPQNIGVYGSMTLSTYLLNHINKSSEAMEEGINYPILIGNDKDFLCTRVSYKCQLTGPSFTVQTACSSSMTAIHLACQSLINGECEMALAGGVSITLPQHTGYLYKEGGVLSKDGKCRAFDRQASGIVKGNGCAIVLLKPLEKALEDRDTIYAVIKSTALNNDAHMKIGFTAPSIQGQSKVIQEAIQMAGISPEEIEYVETHGAGTPLGDPIEVKALTKAFGTPKKQWCAIGSVKPNIGHLDAAAGAAGLIKTALVLHENTIPPNINYEEPNPEIDFLNSPFYVNLIKDERSEENPIRYAGVSSFGLGGTNGHAILQKAPKVHKENRNGHHLFVLSGKTATSVTTIANNLSKAVQQQNYTLSDIAYTLAVGRSEFNYRSFVVAKDRDELISALLQTQIKQIGEIASSVSLSLSSEENEHFFAQLIESHPSYREILEQNIEKLAPHLSVNHWLDHESINDESDQIIKQFLSIYSWCQWMQALEIPINKVISHDHISDYVAAAFSNALMPEQAIQRLMMHSSITDDWQSPTISIQLANGNSLTLEQEINELKEEWDFSLVDITYAKFLYQCGSWWANGGEINWDIWYQGTLFGRVPLPTYPFERKRYWIEPEVQTSIKPSGQTDSDHTQTVSLQDKIITTWKKHLAIEEINLEDDFYIDLGGDSLTAVEIISDLKNEWDIHISMQDFLNYSTPADLIEHLEKKQATKQKQTKANASFIQKIKDGTQPNTIFLIHPAGGNIKVYYDLASQLNHHPTIYGIAYPNDWEMHEPTIEELAERYIKEIRQILPSGPYQLGGYSMGGNIAFEMAIQLEALGEKVEDLIMIDSYVPQTYHQAHNNQQAYKEAFPRMANLLFRPNISIDEDMQKELASLPLETMIQRLQEMNIIPEGIAANEWIHFFDLWRKNSLSLRKYAPSQLFSGNIILFDAMDPSLDSMLKQLGMSPEKKERWQDYIQGKLSIYPVSGNHYSIFSDKNHLKNLANQMEEIFQNMKIN